jgi:hypothetical protein
VPFWARFLGANQGLKYLWKSSILATGSKAENSKKYLLYQLDKWYLNKKIIDQKLRKQNML